MDQQSIGEEKLKISRSKARHLRRKRLIDARRTADTSLSLNRSDIEQNSSLQGSHGILTKSKARRLRQKKKAESIKSSGQTLKIEKRDPDNQTELLISSQSSVRVSDYDKSGRNICGSQFNAVESFDHGNLLHSSAEVETLDSDPDDAFDSKSKENNTLLNEQQNLSSNTFVLNDNKSLGNVRNERDSLSSDDSHVYEASVSQLGYQIGKNSDSKVLTDSTSIETKTKRYRKSNDNRDDNDSLFKTELYQSSSESDINSELLDSNKSLSENQILFYDQNRDFELTGRTRIANIKSNQLSKNNERVVKETDGREALRKKENEDKIEGALHDFDFESSDGIKTKTSASLRIDVASDDDLDSSCSNSSSHLIDSYEINAIQAHYSLGPITNTVKTVLNSTELIENEKNLKISSGSNSHAVFQPNASAIDLTTYSGSDLIINTDCTLREIEEQQMIIDLISESSSNFIQNNRLFYTDRSEISNTERQNKNKNHKKSMTENLFKLENQSSFDLIKDYSLPSTSLNDSVSSMFNESQGKMSSVEKTREQIKAEREAKKVAKALAKGKAKVPKSEEKNDLKSSSEHATAKASGSEKIQKDAKPNVVAKKQVITLEEKIVTTKIETAASTDNKENESHSKVDGKSKRESRAERRAKQEAQRAAKEKQAAEKSKPNSTGPLKLKALPRVADPVKMTVRKALVDNKLHEVKLFKHLYHERELSLVNGPTLNSNIHPAIVRLGVQYANKVIIGSNARCVALLAAVKQLIEDFERPSQADFTRGLEASLQECAAYLHHCRPMAVSMQNALKHLKWQMTQLPTTVSDNDAKSRLRDAIDTYIKEQIELAGKAISNTIQTKISNGDIILTYAFSSLIHNILIDAHNAGKQFRVIIVDGRPWLEGKEQLRRLAKHGIECSYILINALSFIMPEVSKVFLGAHAILANGAVMSRAGTAQVALMAKAFNVPVLVACETHKSCERVQTDSFVYNEIGDADELVRHFFSNSKKSPLGNWKTKKSLDLLNITFDVTPADLVSAVVTELAILPCTSIPVILRIKPSEI